MVGIHEKIRWFPQGSHQNFARVFDGVEVEIGDIKFTMTKYLIAKATKLPHI